MSAFHPGPGWRSFDLSEPLGNREYLHYGTDGDDEGVFWVRVPEATGLPTVEGYYASESGVVRLSDGIWDDTWGNPLTEQEVRAYLPFVRLEESPDAD